MIVQCSHLTNGLKGWMTGLPDGGRLQFLSLCSSLLSSDETVGGGTGGQRGGDYYSEYLQP